MEFTLEQRNLIAALSQMRNAQERLNYLVERGRRDPPLEAVFKTDAFRVEGCLSKLWLVGSLREGRCYFQADSDSQIVRSVARLLCELCSGHTPKEILAGDLSSLNSIGIEQLLTPNRRNTLSRLWERIQDFARSQSIQSG